MTEILKSYEVKTADGSVYTVSYDMDIVNFINNIVNKVQWIKCFYVKDIIVYIRASSIISIMELPYV